MRAIVLAAVLLVLAGCGGSSHGEARYDVKAAMRCIRHAQPSEAVVGKPEEAESPGGFYTYVTDDRIGTMQFVLVVAYGPNRAAAIRREHLAHLDLRKPYRALRRAWERRDGNVVYEALGPTRFGRPVRVLPPGKTADDALRAVKAAGARMRGEFAKCLQEARLD